MRAWERRVPPGPHPRTRDLGAPAPQAAVPGGAGARPPPAFLRPSRLALWRAGEAAEPCAPHSPKAFVALPLAERGFCNAGQIKMSSIILFDRMIPYDEVSARKGVKMVNS